MKTNQQITADRTNLTVPSDIMEAAEKVAHWATMNGFKSGWCIGPVQDRAAQGNGCEGLLRRARRNVEHSASHEAGAASRELLKEIDAHLSRAAQGSGEPCPVCGSISNQTKEQLADEISKLIKIGAMVSHAAQAGEIDPVNQNGDSRSDAVSGSADGMCNAALVDFAVSQLNTIDGTERENARRVIRMVIAETIKSIQPNDEAHLLRDSNRSVQRGSGHR